MTSNTIIPYNLIQAIASLDNIYETRLFGWLIAKAQSVLKLYNKDLGDINLEHAMDVVRVTLPARYLLVEGDRNYRNIKKGFSLASKKIVNERDNIYQELNIIAFPELRKRGGRLEVTFVIHNEMWHALLNFSKGYRIINLPTYMELKSAYSIILYILISQQSQAITYQMTTLRQLLGIDGKQSYQRTNSLMERIIKPAKVELDKCSPWTFSWSMTRTGRGGGYHAITLIPHANEAYVRDPQEHPRDTHIRQQRVRLDDRVAEYLTQQYDMSPQEQERVEGYLVQMGDWETQIDFLARVRHAARRKDITNHKGYLVNALRQSV